MQRPAKFGGRSWLGRGGPMEELVADLRSLLGVPVHVHGPLSSAAWIFDSPNDHISSLGSVFGFIHERRL